MIVCFIGVSSLSTLEDITRIPKTTLSAIIPEVCEAIYNVLQPEHLYLPQKPMSGLKRHNSLRTFGNMDIVWEHLMENMSKSSVLQTQDLSFLITKVRALSLARSQKYLAIASACIFRKKSHF